MPLEVEARILEVDVTALRDALDGLGAIQYEEVLMREMLFSPANESGSGYVRVRDDGNRVTVTHKRPLDPLSREETEFGADSYRTAVALFDAIGLRRMLYREKHRVSFRLDDAAISIDQYPGIPALVEVEAPDASRVEAVCVALGLDFSSHFPGGTPEIYQHYGLELTPGDSLQFTDDTLCALYEAGRIGGGTSWRNGPNP